MASPGLAPLPTKSARPSLRLEVITEHHQRKHPFNAEFLERRMRQHKKLQRAMARQLGQQIVDEVAKMLEGEGQ